MPDREAVVVEIDGTCNFRDLGGLPLAAGGATRHGVLYRSDALSTLSPEGMAALDATPIGVVVDFRTPAERTSAPDLLPSDRTVRTVQLSILEGAMADAAQGLLGDSATPSPEALAAAMSALPTLGDLYVGMLEHSGGAFAEVARLVAASDDREPSAVLVHCTAGKDRTGVASALLLDAVGVERRAVIADYTSSESNLAPTWAPRMLALVTSTGLPLTPALTTLVTGTPAAAIEQALAWISDRHGSSADYLLNAGLSDSELASLIARLAA